MAWSPKMWTFWLILRRFVHPDLRGAYDRMTVKHKFMFLGVHAMDKMNLWHRLPVFLALLYLEARRFLHQKYNLIHVGKVETLSFNPEDYPYRMADGRFNDPTNSEAGCQMSFIGRNNPPAVELQDQMRADPDPFVVAQKLLERREFKDTGKQFNVIAAAWIQFMIHGWIDHMEDTTKTTELTNESADAGKCPLNSFKFYATKTVRTGDEEGGVQTGHRNDRVPWWDGSVIYGNNKEDAMRLRTETDGKLHIQDNNLLPCDDDGKLASGDVRNSWIGVSLLQALFVKEHNAVCDALKEEYPDLFDDEKLYQHAKLVNSAVMAKIHTIDWTVELLKTRTMRSAMRANWYGLLGKKFKSKFGHVGGPTLGPILGGLVGMKQSYNHGVPYSLTEDFACVYRMHSLLPDELRVVDITKPPPSHAKEKPAPYKSIGMKDLVGSKGETCSREEKLGFETQLASMGYQACGALVLCNYPSFLRDLVVQDDHGRDRKAHVDLPVLEVYRDRERSVPRYNQFRRGLLMIPISKWKDLTNDAEEIKTLREVYGDDVEKLDLLVGLMAEKKIKGFAISETAFFVFLLMASRRLEADRFFTSDFNEKTYTKRGLDWVNTTETLRDVIQRHFPDVAKKWLDPATSAFSVWKPPSNK